MERDLARRSAERIVSAISRRLVIARGAAIGTTIEQGLGEAAQHVGADGATLMRTAFDDRIEFLHSWFDPALPPLPMQNEHHSRSYDWVKHRLTTRGAQVIDMREVAARLGRPVAPPELRKVALVGTFAGEHVVGVICFYYRTDATPTADVLEPLEVLGDVLLGAIARRDAENELAVARRLEAIGQLAGGVAHDINNALTVILLHAERGERLTTGPARDSFQAILGAGQRASEVAHQLLAFARRESTQPRACDPGRLVESLLSMLERLVGEHIRIRCTTAEDCWPVLVDPIQLERVLINLAANARDAMPEGGTLDITIVNRKLRTPGKLPAGDYVAIEMRDTGPGMPPEVVARLFEPFFTTKSDRGGTGLGLASSYGVMQQLGGTIEIESIVGAGTRSTVLCRRSEIDAASSDRFLAVEPPRGRGVGRTILLAEDVELLRQAIAHILSEEGYHVLVASDGAEAHRRALETETLDALVTDVVLPGIHGYRLAELVRQQRPELPVLYLSGYDRPQGLEAALAQPRTAFASKPFASDELIASLARLLA